MVLEVQDFIPGLSPSLGSVTHRICFECLLNWTVLALRGPSPQVQTNTGAAGETFFRVCLCSSDIAGCTRAGRKWLVVFCLFLLRFTIEWIRSELDYQGAGPVGETNKQTNKENKQKKKRLSAVMLIRYNFFFFKNFFVRLGQDKIWNRSSRPRKCVNRKMKSSLSLLWPVFLSTPN